MSKLMLAFILFTILAVGSLTSALAHNDIMGNRARGDAILQNQAEAKAFREQLNRRMGVSEDNGRKLDRLLVDVGKLTERIDGAIQPNGPQ